MVRKRTKRTFWVIFLSLLGVASILFNRQIAEALELPTTIFFTIVGGVFLVLSLLIGLNR